MKNKGEAQHQIYTELVLSALSEFYLQYFSYKICMTCPFTCNPAWLETSLKTDRQAFLQDLYQNCLSRTNKITRKYRNTLCSSVRRTWPLLSEVNDLSLSPRTAAETTDMGLSVTWHRSSNAERIPSTANTVPTVIAVSITIYATDNYWLFLRSFVIGCLR